MINREVLYKWTKNRIALLVAQILVLLICLAYFHYIYYFNIYPDKQAKEKFATADCFLVSKNLGSKKDFITKYRANFYITYNYKGNQYSRWVSGNGLDRSYSRDKVEQENILTQFIEGKNYDCWVNPASPDVSVLVLRQNWMAMTHLILPSIVIVILTYYLIKNISLLFSRYFMANLKRQFV